MPKNGVDQPEPEHPTPSEREYTNLRLTKLEVDVAHTVSKAYLEKSIGDMKTGITEAVGKMETTVAKSVGEVKMWVISVLATIALALIGIVVTVYKIFSTSPVQ